LLFERARTQAFLLANGGKGCFIGPASDLLQFLTQVNGVA
jgi:hypothetical protein